MLHKVYYNSISNNNPINMNNFIGLLKCQKEIKKILKSKQACQVLSDVQLVLGNNELDSKDV